jgi:hypothetical protein
MTRGRAIRCYDYVNHPYARVRDALAGDTLAVFQAATRAASSRAEKVAAQLRVNIAGVEVAKDIAIEVHGIEEDARGPDATPTLRLALEWEAADSPRLFPFMQAELSIYPLTATETQLDFSGRYEAPLGAFGSAMNALVGHRIAEASVHRFLADVARHLRAGLGR